MSERIIDSKTKYKNSVLLELSNFLKGKYPDPDDFLSSDMKYLWKNIEDTTAKVILIYGDYTIIINCIYGFYGYKCDHKGISIYKDASIAETYKDIWNKGIKNILIDKINLILAIKKYNAHLFNKKSQIEKYAGDFFEDTCNMLTQIPSDLEIPDNLSLKNLHDFLSESLTLDSYKSYNPIYLEQNKEISKFSGKYLNKYDVIIPKDIYEHHKYGIQFRNCIVSYIKSVSYINKILFVYKDDKPLFCVECSNDFVVRQAKKICNESLSKDEEDELENILSQIKKSVSSSVIQSH
jgi:hypothetical protein